jgi:hypothetical protein
MFTYQAYRPRDVRKYDTYIHVYTNIGLINFNELPLIMSIIYIMKKLLVQKDET